MTTYQILGYGYTWWRGDALPTLPPLPGWRVTGAAPQILAAISGQTPAEIEQRLRAAHQPYLAWLDDQPVAYGWSATRQGAIEELELRFTIPPGNRYLWDFVTLPAWRGRGIYGRLLQAILGLEAPHAERFWIATTVDNHAAQRAILRAGFRRVDALVRTAEGRLRVLALDHGERAAVGPFGLQLGLLSRAEQDRS
ncbi:GNAT family N-acetyltransferase [Kallotenue papyrolyticum]|uniref:GNAT family N-acetyltransferase n=1 Tax=Kallotenue papyrolyticum TaxID=1325125 RepID=UPI0004929CC1|nr:GNAT family N-acetyltransferase [Kallotenue papyrolyticum]